MHLHAVYHMHGGDRAACPAHCEPHIRDVSAETGDTARGHNAPALTGQKPEKTACRILQHKTYRLSPKTIDLWCESRHPAVGIL